MLPIILMQIGHLAVEKCYEALNSTSCNGTTSGKKSGLGPQSVLTWRSGEGWGVEGVQRRAERARETMLAT